MERLSIKAVAVALGATWGFLVLSLGWTSAFGWGTKAVETLSSVYIGYAPGFVGGIIGGLWAFADGAIGGAIFALIYNRVARRTRV
jgi:hypothetical protein